ncbi:LysR family transcriptional regulator [uncultured Vibrio sp.]|uniref:LysR family transcriptional regulator n=1 Tax=uncultured Vibrio sp. TaxID=114054 RepID=UPI000912EAAA|nr:LysR family transcriptional regulator [uncultured Vibrio sp.]OIQ26540.1 MAG: hypothetical protein BM561_01955 [Vibrio sp. MedPE-SWchi]
MDTLNAMRIFVRVTETGNFSKTADELNTSPSYVSKQISALEKALGIRLIQRTTRVLTLTEAGKSYLHHCHKIIEQLTVAESEISEMLGSPSGLLRISMPSVLGDRANARMSAEFLRRYPDIDLDIMIEDRFVDVIEEGYDVCIRASAEFPDSTLIYKKIGELSIHLMASQSYIDKHGHPKTAAELSHHPLISHRYSNSNAYLFEKEGKTESVVFKRKVRVNSSSFVRHIVEQGEGIGFLPLYPVNRTDQANQMEHANPTPLISLLPDYREGNITISLVYPERTYTPLKVHKFIEFFDEWFNRNR